MTDTQTPPLSRFSLTPDERETTITLSDGDALVRIWTAQRKYINRLRKHESFTETGTGYHGNTEWATFTIPADQWNPASGAKRKSKPMTDEQRAAAAARLAKARTETR